MAKLPWHGPLFHVSRHLALRYAEALKQALGLDCPLTEFDVDRMGWSPQIAALLGEDYLGSGSLRYALILSPDQATAPPVRRRFSYEAGLIEQVYLDARPTLLSLIEFEPIIIEFDNGQAFCRSAADVLSIKQVEACFSTPRDTLGKTRSLLDLATGLGEQSRLLDDGYIDQMLALVKEIGDPRQRPLPPTLRISINSLWADLAGGVYVLRIPRGNKRATLVITAQPDDRLHKLNVSTIGLDDPKLVDELHELGLLHFDRKETLLAQRLAELETDALLMAGEEKPASDGTERRRQVARNRKVHDLLPEVYWELDGVHKRVQGGGGFHTETLSPAAKWALSTARDTDFAPTTRDADTLVLIHLLTRFVPCDYRMLTHHHRRMVEQAWSSYSSAKQRYLTQQFPYLTPSFVPSPPAQPHADASSSASEAGAQSA